MAKTIRGMSRVKRKSAGGTLITPTDTQIMN